MAEPTLDILLRLKNHIAQMAPHQKKRETGKLLIEATNKIEALEETIKELTLPE